MPVRTKQLVKEKRKIILDILFEDIIPDSSPKMYWSMEMLTAQVRRHNIDEKIRITKYDIKRVINSVSNNNKINLHIINNNLYATFS